MKSVGAFHAKTHFSSLLDEVEKGEEILITKHGRAVAKLCAVDRPPLSSQEAVHHLKKFRQEHQLTLGADWKLLRDEGKK